MIDEKEFVQFDGKFWKPLIGGQHFITCNDWSIQMIPFRENPAKPKLCLSICEIDGKPVEKIFQTGNRTLIQLQLQPIILEAQHASKRIIKLLMTRNGENEYRVSSILGGVN